MVGAKKKKKIWVDNGSQQIGFGGNLPTRADLHEFGAVAVFVGREPLVLVVSNQI